jgi:hypothetical protein
VRDNAPNGVRYLTRRSMLQLDMQMNGREWMVVLGLSERWALAALRSLALTGCAA